MKKLFLFALIAAGCSQNVNSISNTKKESLRTYVHVSAEDLQAEYIATPTIALQKYEYARITGRVKNISKDSMGLPRIEFYTSNPNAEIIARFDSDFPGAQLKDILVADCETSGRVFDSVAVNFCKLQANQGQSSQ